MAFVCVLYLFMYLCVKVSMKPMLCCLMFVGDWWELWKCRVIEWFMSCWFWRSSNDIHTPACSL